MGHHKTGLFLGFGVISMHCMSMNRMGIFYLEGVGVVGSKPMYMYKEKRKVPPPLAGLSAASYGTSETYSKSCVKQPLKIDKTS